MDGDIAALALSGKVKRTDLLDTTTLALNHFDVSLLALRNHLISMKPTTNEASKHSAEQKITEDKNTMSHNELIKRQEDPFILVLIDGNRMVFHHNFLNKGGKGGSHAANVINNVALDWALINIPEAAEDINVIVRVYADVCSTTEACVSAGIINHSAMMEDFVVGFNSANSLFDFVDVGTTKGGTNVNVIGESTYSSLHIRA